mgnify:CR=1 FL=1
MFEVRIPALLYIRYSVGYHIHHLVMTNIQPIGKLRLEWISRIRWIIYLIIIRSVIKKISVQPCVRPDILSIPTYICLDFP